jgi:uncharacterized protein (DUF1810 family)
MIKSLYGVDVSGSFRAGRFGGVTDPFHLDRFVRAQNGIYDDVLAELRAGRKRRHWMWFVFPQIHGLGSSSTARTYAISSAEEARAYLAHPVLGPRLRECAGLLTSIEGRTADEIFGYPDNLKLRSSMTLFARTAPEPGVFAEVLDRYFDGPDERTIEMLAG